MNESTSPNVDILLDRLVDGDLSKGERRLLLESFDKEPENWRRCALAFLEAQAWQEEMEQIAHEQTVSTTHTDFLPPELSLKQRMPLASMAMWLTMAASLLVAFGLGWTQHEIRTSVATRSTASRDQVVGVAPPSHSVHPGKAISNDTMTLFVKDDSGRMQSVRVPLVDAKTLDKELGVTFQTGVPSDFRDQLKNNGYTVHSKRQYAPLWLENGRPMILPVEDTNIVPVNNHVY